MRRLSVWRSGPWPPERVCWPPDASSPPRMAGGLSTQHSSTSGARRLAPEDLPRDAHVLANASLQPGASVTAQYRPQLERTEAAPEHLCVLAQAGDLFADP